MVLDKDAPLKKNEIKGNETTFKSKQLSKVIMTKSKLKSSYCK